MSDNNELFVIYRDGGRAVASKVTGLPARCVNEGRPYELVADLGDFNHLLNERNELVGFELEYAEEFFHEITTSRLVVETTNVDFSAGILRLRLGEGGVLRSDSCQGIGTWAFSDGHGDHIIIISEIVEWGQLWSAVAFEIVKGGPVSYFYA